MVKSYSCIFPVLRQFPHVWYEENPVQAESFTLKFSEIYRYVVTHLDDETVPVHEEIHFVKLSACTGFSSIKSANVLMLLNMKCGFIC